ncbi:MAG: ATP-binding protein [Akkermansia sp.]|nr:ATP-binding protein [Akkermansia sp.]
MKRESENALLKWHQNPGRKPLLLLGARQVGKTWLMRHFGEKHFKHVAYIRFDRNERMRTIFETSDYNIEELLLHLQAEVRHKITPGKTLLILDEIQECPAALTSLKYFCEDLPELHVMAAGSLLGVQQHYGTGFPVGKVNTMTLYPMSFREFLNANGYETDTEMLDQCNWKSIQLFANRFEHQLKIYYYVGGMPEAVKTYVDTQDFNAVREVQNEILSNYSNDFSKHVPKLLAAKVSLLWESVPHQLAKENKRFVYNDVQKNMRARDLEDAMDWLLRAGLIYQVHRINEAALPIAAYRDGAFKLYFLDVGLLGAKSGLDISVILEKNAIFREFKGALTEQYVQQEMRAKCDISPHYWQSDSSRSEIDFIFQNGMNIVPVEVKAETNTKAKSLLNFCRRYTPKLAVRSSMNDYKLSELSTEGVTTTTLLDIPLYSISQIAKICSSQQPPLYKRENKRATTSLS